MTEKYAWRIRRGPLNRDKLNLDEETAAYCMESDRWEVTIVTWEDE